MRTQHVCPFCGVVMYETGGGYKRRDLITVIVCGLLALAILVAMFLIGQWAPR